jgi:hypothetical protein
MRRFELWRAPLISPDMHLELSDEEAAALIKELAEITGNDRYPVLGVGAARRPTKFYAASREQQRTETTHVSNRRHTANDPERCYE